MSDQHTPAFPIRDLNEHPGPLGMTLRDYFAAKFAAAMITATSNVEGFPDSEFVIYGPPKETVGARVARSAYGFADAMLAARGAA